MQVVSFLYVKTINKLLFICFKKMIQQYYTKNFPKIISILNIVQKQSENIKTEYFRLRLDCPTKYAQSSVRESL